MGVRTASIATVPWADAEKVFGTRGDPSRCWCQFFKVTNAEFQNSSPDSLCATLKIQTPDEPGLLAYLEDEPVGWVAVEPRTRYATLRKGAVITASVLPEELDEHGEDAVWAVTCFVVRVGYRKRGVASALLAAAVDHARASGARTLEGYPVDVAERGKASSAELYHGTLSLFEGAGFSVDVRPSPGRAVVSLAL